ncbi:MAG: TonB-dependent receptor [Opitutae bacterium]|nr:TonB-dependent receptor [Opitutae bacterium]
MFALASLAWGASTASKRFDVPSDAAERALKVFSTQAGVDVLFPADVVAGVRTRAVSGEMTPREALTAMLTGTSLAAFQDEKTGAWTLRRIATKDAESKNEASVSAPAPSPDAAVSGRGSISGRVQDGATGQYLVNARISVMGSNRTVFTNSAGEFQLDDLPAGPVGLSTFFTGQQAAQQTVNVVAGQTASCNFVLRGIFDKAASGKEDMVVLEEFVVSTKRAQSAAELAINEQRFSGNIKSVVATESFGDIAQNNIGEFLKYLPGVEVVYGDMNVGGIQLRGMPASQTNISIDGGGVSVPGSGNSTRSLNMQTISLNNVSRIEVTKSVLPDQRSDSLGGTLNLVSRTAFERSKPEFNYKTFLNMNSHFAELRKTPAGKKGGDGSRRKWFPDFEVNYVNPISKTFGIALNATRNDQFTLSRRLSKGYNVANAAGPVTANDGFAARDHAYSIPYLSSFTLLNYPSFEERTTAGIKIDWRPAPRDVLSLTANTNYYFSNFEQHNLQFNTGNMNNPLTPTGAANGSILAGGYRDATTGMFSGTFTQGRPGQGSVIQTLQTNYGAQANNVVRLNYRHTGADWDIDAAAGGNKAKLWYRNESYGQIQQARVRITNATVRFDDINQYGPQRITVANNTGTALIDPNVLSNYNLMDSTFSQDRDSRANARNLDLNVKRKFVGEKISGSIKGGMAWRSDARDVYIWRHSDYSTYLGPDGRANSGDETLASLPPGTLQAPLFSSYAMIRGYPAPQWVSAKKVYDLGKQNPTYFTNTIANQAADYNGTVDSTEELVEKVTAAYVMGDVSLFKNRLRVVGGVRGERWQFDGRGVLVDIARGWVKDANGKPVDGNPTQAGVQPIALGDALAVAKLTHLELGKRLTKQYDKYFPSLSATYNITENLAFKFGYAKTIGRPDYNNYLPAINISRVNNAADSAIGSSLGTINAKDPNIKPWISDNFDASLEYYTTSGGLFSIAGFRKNITNFFSNTPSIATADYLDKIGLPQDYVGYLVNTPGNVTGITHMTGIELSAQQTLSRALSVFANVSVNRNVGAVDADFRGFVRQRINAGFNWSWQRFAGMVKFYYTGKNRTNANTGIAPDGWQYTLARPRIDASVDYRVSRHVTVFLAGRNVFNDRDKLEMAGSSTPAYARYYIESEYGVLFQLGVRGSF